MAKVGWTIGNEYRARMVFSPLDLLIRLVEGHEHMQEAIVVPPSMEVFYHLKLPPRTCDMLGVYRET